MADTLRLWIYRDDQIQKWSLLRGTQFFKSIEPAARSNPLQGFKITGAF